MLCILSGEIYYLRILMVNCPVLSWKDAKTFEGTEYNTFQEAAVARGLIDDKSDAVNAFEEMINFSTPAELRALFVFSRLMDTLQFKYSGIQIIIADCMKTLCCNDIALK